MNKLHTLKQQLKSISSSPNWTSAFDNFLDASRTTLSSTITLSNPVNVFDPITLPAGYRIVGYGVRLNDDVSFDPRIDSRVYYPQFRISTLKSSPAHNAATSDEILNISSSNNDLNNLTSGSEIDDLTGQGGVQGPFYEKEPFGTTLFNLGQLSYTNLTSSIELSDGELAIPTLNKGVLVSHFDESWYTNSKGDSGYSEINYWGGYDGGSSQAMSPQHNINYYFKLGFVTLNTTTPGKLLYNSVQEVDNFPATGKVEDESRPYDMYTSYIKPEALMNPTATATAYMNIQKIV